MILPAISDRVSIDPNSPHFWPEFKRLGVRLDGQERPDDVIEFCQSGSWARIHVKDKAGKPRFERGRPVAFQKHGKVEPYYREQADG